MKTRLRKNENECQNPRNNRNAEAFIEFLPVTADRICYLGKKLEYVQLFSGRKFVVSQENKKKNETNK
jgi:hypothetical protein